MNTYEYNLARVNLLRCGETHLFGGKDFAVTCKHQAGKFQVFLSGTE